MKYTIALALVLGTYSVNLTAQEIYQLQQRVNMIKPVATPVSVAAPRAALEVRQVSESVSLASNASYKVAVSDESMYNINVDRKSDEESERIDVRADDVLKSKEMEIKKSLIENAKQIHSGEQPLVAVGFFYDLRIKRTKSLIHFSGKLLKTEDTSPDQVTKFNLSVENDGTTGDFVNMVFRNMRSKNPVSLSLACDLNKNAKAMGKKTSGKGLVVINAEINHANGCRLLSFQELSK